MAPNTEGGTGEGMNSHARSRQVGGGNVSKRRHGKACRAFFFSVKLWANGRTRVGRCRCCPL